MHHGLHRGCHPGQEEGKIYLVVIPDALGLQDESSEDGERALLPRALSQGRDGGGQEHSLVPTVPP